VIVADGGADAGPLWQRLVIALVPPILAAIIAGYFALSKTVSRRTERLKNLNEIRQTCPEWINPAYALERIMLREVQALEKATTLVFRVRKWYLIVGSLFILCTYTYLALFFLKIVKPPGLWMPESVLGIVGLGIPASSFIVNRGRGNEKRRSINEQYKRAFAALDKRAEQGQSPPSESEEQDAPE
jgi:hypothetical protein